MTYDNTPEDRFAPPGPRDEPELLAECAWCGGEIYAGDAVTTVHLDKNPVHDRCEHAWIESYVVKERGVIGADGTIE